MQPIWSEGLFCSIRLSATKGAHFASACADLPTVVVIAGALRLLIACGAFGAEACDVFRVSQHLGHTSETAALDADLLHEAVDQRRLNAVAQGGIDDFIGDVSISLSAAAVSAVNV